MPRDYIHIGSSPAEETCAQVGTAEYYELSKLELAAFKKGLEEKFPPPPGASYGINEGEVVVYYNDDNEKAVEFAFMVEGNTPGTWEELGLKAPRLDDPAFTATDLMEVPEKGKRWMGDGNLICQLSDTHFRAAGCIETIGNEFVDGVVKAAGSWAIMCPACFGQNGGGLGLGKGQRYRKAKDGNFYKVEG